MKMLENKPLHVYVLPSALRPTWHNRPMNCVRLATIEANRKRLPDAD